MSRKEADKKREYQALAADLANQWTGYTVRVVPVAIGVLGTIKGAGKALTGIHFLEFTEISTFLSSAQREVLTSAVQIVKRHMSMKRT